MLPLTHTYIGISIGEPSVRAPSEKRNNRTTESCALCSLTRDPHMIEGRYVGRTMVVCLI